MARITTTIATIALAAAFGSSALASDTASAPTVAPSVTPKAISALPLPINEGADVSDNQAIGDANVVAGIFGANDEQLALVKASLDRFADAGLSLPELAISVHESKEGCAGHNGLYRSGGDVERIDICHVSEFIVLHELAHAWDFNNSTEEIRSEFLEAAGLTHWSGEDVPWLDRGAERAANVVATTLASESIVGCGDTAADLMEILTGTECSPGA